MKTYIALALAATVLVAGCKEEKDEAATAARTEQAAATCSNEELMQMSQELATKLQQHPEKAQELMAKMQEMAPKLQEATSGGEVNEELVNELCVAYTDMLADF